MLNNLTPTQIQSKLDFIKNYITADTAADGSIVDPNANVTSKNVATMEAELYKYENIQVNRAIVCDKITQMFGADLAAQYLEDIHSHLIYVHDETSLKPYCASITLYPFLFDGSKAIGGTSSRPRNLQSFCGSFVNLMYQIAGGFAGAGATVGFLMYFDYFAKKTYGRNYLTTNSREIQQELQGVIYSMNQPAAARGFQSIFWNISVFDEHYFTSLFDEFYFPDGTKPDYETLKQLQEFFMEWFRKERRKELLTFPVITAAYLVEEDTAKDKDFLDLLADQMSKASFTMSLTAQIALPPVVASATSLQTIRSAILSVLVGFPQVAYRLSLSTLIDSDSHTSSCLMSLSVSRSILWHTEVTIWI